MIKRICKDLSIFKDLRSFKVLGCKELFVKRIFLSIGFKESLSDEFSLCYRFNAPEAFTMVKDI